MTDDYDGRLRALETAGAVREDKLKTLMAQFERVIDRLDEHNRAHDVIDVCTTQLDKRLTVVELTVQQIGERMDSVSRAAWGVAIAIGLSAVGLILKGIYDWLTMGRLP